MPVDPILLERLACPCDSSRLTETDSGLCCSFGHSYSVVDDVPVILLDDEATTLWVAESSRQLAVRQGRDVAADPYFLETLGISNEQRSELKQNLSVGGTR